MRSSYITWFLSTSYHIWKYSHIAIGLRRGNYPPTATIMYCTSLGESSLLIKCTLHYTTVVSSFHTHIHTGLYYEHACNVVYQEMCFHEASKLNQGQCAKTFITQSRQGGVATQQTGGAHSTNLANKSAITQSKVSVASKPAGNLKQPNGASIGKDGVPQVGSCYFYIESHVCMWDRNEWVCVCVF